MGLGLLSIYLNLKWKQNDFLKHIVIIYEMVKCKLPGDTVTQTARAARKFFFGARKNHFDPVKTLGYIQELSTVFTSSYMTSHIYTNYIYLVIYDKNIFLS